MTESIINNSIDNVKEKINRVIELLKIFQKLKQKYTKL